MNKKFKEYESPVAEVLENYLLVRLQITKYLWVVHNEFTLLRRSLFPVAVLRISFEGVKPFLAVMHPKEKIQQKAEIREHNEYRYPGKCLYRVLTAHNHRGGGVNCQTKVHYIQNRRDYLPSAL